MSPMPSRPRSPSRAALALLPVFGLAAVAPPQAPSAVVTWLRAADWEELHGKPLPLLLDTGPADIPALVDVMTRGTEPQRMLASYVLGYAGGDAAIDALRTHLGHARPASAMLCLALGARGNAADRADLILALDGVHFAEQVPPVGAAALKLGILPETRAVPALERLAIARSWGSTEAQEALRWIRDGPWTVDGVPAASDEDRIITAALRNGIPDGGHASAYQDDSRGGVWIFDGHAWRFRAGARAGDTPGLSFEVTMNRDHNRAILSVGLAYAPLAGAGYDYLLTRETDGWRVRAAYPTWIS